MQLVNGDASESTIKKSILTFLYMKNVFCWNNESVGIYNAAKGCYMRKNSIFQMKGVSDICGIFNGQPLFIEVKSEKGVLSQHQRYFLERATAEGAIAFVAGSIKDVEDTLGL